MSVLVVAPHADDETLGCGATLLRHRAEERQVHWLLLTEMHRDAGYSDERIARRQQQIEAVASHYGFAGTHRLGYPTATLDTIPRAELVAGIGEVVGEVEPTTIYLPNRGDVHSDHAVAFDAAVACTKRFRYPSVRQVRAYETPSETDQGLAPDSPPFRPDLFVDISGYLDGKIAAMELYGDEMGEHPFPRSPEGVRALALVRGATAGIEAAEAFMSLREIL